MSWTSTSSLPPLWLPWILCLSLLPSCVAVTAVTPTSTSANPDAVLIQALNNNNNNSSSSSSSSSNRLLFQAGPPGSRLRACSCPPLVPPCDRSLAHLLCSCRDLGGAPGPPAGLVTVWLWGGEPLLELLNGSRVHRLQLVSCGPAAVGRGPGLLALRGLRSLSISSRVPGALFPLQEADLSGGEEGGEGEEAGRGSPPLRVTFLDVALLNGRSALRAYSVTGRSGASLAAQFPHLPLGGLLPPPPSGGPPPTRGPPPTGHPPPPRDPPLPRDPPPSRGPAGGSVSGDPPRRYVLTFVY